MASAIRFLEFEKVSNYINRIDFSYKDKHGMTLFHYLCCDDRWESIIIIILENNNNNLLQLVNKLGYTPLHIAAGDGQKNVTKVLLDHGANVNVTTINMCTTPISLAAAKGNYEVII